MYLGRAQIYLGIKHGKLCRTDADVPSVSPVSAIYLDFIPAQPVRYHSQELSQIMLTMIYTAYSDNASAENLS
jgi:hypothetical protein